MRASWLMMFLVLAVVTGTRAMAQDVPDEATAIAKIEQLGGKIISARPMGVNVEMEPVPLLVIPFWAVVMPLALLSAYLLLSKPRSAKSAGN